MQLQFQSQSLTFRWHFQMTKKCSYFRSLARWQTKQLFQWQAVRLWPLVHRDAVQRQRSRTHPERARERGAEPAGGGGQHLGPAVRSAAQNHRKYCVFFSVCRVEFIQCVHSKFSPQRSVISCSLRKQTFPGVSIQACSGLDYCIYDLGGNSCKFSVSDLSKDYKTTQIWLKDINILLYLSKFYSLKTSVFPVFVLLVFRGVINVHSCSLACLRIYDCTYESLN